MKQFDQENNDILCSRYLLCETGEQETKEVEELLEADPDFRKELEGFKTVIDMVQILQTDTNKAWERFKNKFEKLHPAERAPSRRIVPLFRRIAIAASVIILVGIASFFGYRTFMSKTLTIASSQETVQLDLKDGTMITLNRSSEIQYPRKFGKYNRTVTLKGEGFFNVEPDPDKPFIIETKDLTVTVLGTTFYVKAFPGEFPEVFVETGKVRCYYKPTGDEIILEAGETVKFGTVETVKGKATTSDLNTYAWKTFSLKFENERLGQIITLVNKAYGSKLETVPEIQDCRLTVNFNNLSINGVMNVLQTILDIRFEKNKDKILIKGDGC